MTSSLKTQLDRLVQARNEARAKMSAITDRAEREGRKMLTESETKAFRELKEQIEGSEDSPGLNELVGTAAAELKRSGYGAEAVDRVRAAIRGEPGAVGNTAAPLHFDVEQLRTMHSAILSRQTFAIEARAFNTIDSFLPPQLYPGVVGPQHEGRLLNRLPAMPIDVPSYEFIRHNSTSGSAAVTAEGSAKPEVTLNTEKVVVSAKKVAVNAGVTWESIQDFDAWMSYVNAELSRLVIDAENDELLSGAGAPDHLESFLHTSGTLSYSVGGTGTVSDGETALDGIETAIARLRTGAALATANLLVLHPDTWSAIRRSKDSQNRYLTAPDPTAGEANSVWGVPVLVTTQQTAGTGIMLDTTKFGRAIVRQPLILMAGYSGTDFVDNVVRLVCEERLNLCVERPAAVMVIDGLPTA